MSTKVETESRKKLHVDAKRTVINGTADVNKLDKITCPWALEKFDIALGNNWTHKEVSMSNDIAQWQSNDVLTSEERNIIERAMGFFSTADSLVGNNIVLALYKNVTNPECRQFLLRQAFEEALHNASYHHIIDSVGMDKDRVYNMYTTVPSIVSKASWSKPYSDSLSDPNFATGSVEKDQEFLKNLIAFYVVFEGLFFYVGFAQVLHLGRMNKMVGTAEQIQYILRDESLHVNFGIDMINQIKLENPHLWSKKFQEEIIEMVKQGVELECAYATDTMPKGILGLNAKMFQDYMRFIANRRFVQIGIEEQYSVKENPLPWMSEMLDLKKEKNFFETRVIEYQTGGALDWDDE